MNRVIKFRGKLIDNGEWVYGDLYHYEKFAQICVHYDDETDDLFQVVPDTVGQFTGLVDKNGKEIYEGDIVKCDEFIYKVDYSENRFASFVLLRKQDMFAHFFGEAMEAFECSVIANVFDNPELLKGGDND